MRGYNDERRLPMVMERGEKLLGLPPLSQVVEVLKKFPDEKQLKLIKEVLETAERMSGQLGQFDAIVNIVREINAMPMDKLEKLEKILKRIEKIVNSAPAELKQFLTAIKEG
jgi:archaellum component FlaC